MCAGMAMIVNTLARTIAQPEYFLNKRKEEGKLLELPIPIYETKIAGLLASGNCVSE
jgi:hypothetical protein